jgi:hypothetical protein
MIAILKDNNFIVREHLSPKGKLIDVQVPTAKTLILFNEYNERADDRKRRLSMLQSKLDETKESLDQNEAYQKEFAQIFAEGQTDTLPQDRRKQARFRVIGYNEFGTIVEPADKRNKNLVVKLGYNITENQEKAED